MRTVDHRFALSNPALVSAPSKKSFSSVSSPILACSDSNTQNLVAGLVQDLWQYPAWATDAVCEKVRTGQYPEIKLEFPPTLPQLCRMIRLELAPLKIEQQRIALTLAIMPRDVALTYEQRQQRAQSAMEWLNRTESRAAKLVGEADDAVAK